ncbi:MAG TPA: RNA polymerase factor sigma-54 [Burkholderiaceae bacterium]|nr:RNA polymerase factor sigma-54 [Burkholderiaceae bacterium]
MKPSLQVRLSQHLALTPQLQQSIRLLQLSTLELHQEVEQMLEQNPFLEADEEGGAAGDGAASAAPADAAAQSTSAEAPAEAPWEGGTEAGAAEPASAAEADAPAMEPLDFDGGGRDDWENGTEREDFDGRAEAPASRNGALDDDESDWTERNTVAPSLADHLREQLLGMRLAPEDMLLVEALIDSLNEDGYLADPLEEVAERLAVILEEANPESTPADAQDAALAAQTLREDLLDRLRCALGWLQNLEPAGVGARDLCECLQLQLRDLPDSEAREAAMTICRGHLESLAKRDLKRLMAATAASEETVREAQALIVALEPKPGRRFTRAEANIVVPDVIVQKSGRGWKVVLNPDVMPKLRINDMYAQVLRQHRSQRGGPDDGGAGATLSARLQEARWFVKNILQRFDTIQRVSQAIVERQKGFFTHGEIAMKPLVLREIADELGLHESTISRVTTAKYMNTPFGTFELKYFFGSSLNTEAGGNASSTAVRALIKQFVSAEDAKKPLSDSQLSAMLEEQGIQVARRTVAKYREALKIAPANLRKAI